MRVIHLVGDKKISNQPEQSAISGIARAVLEFSRYQIKLGHQVTIAAIGKQYWNSEWEGVHIISLPYCPSAQINVFNRSLDFRQHIPYIKMLLSDRYDVIHSHNYGYMRFLKGSIKIFHYHSDPLYEGSNNEGIHMKQADFDTVSKYSDTQIAISNFVADQLKTGFKGRCNLKRVYYGVDSQYYNYSRWEKQRNNFRLQIGIPNNAIVFLYAGAIVPEKGVLQLVNTFLQLAQHHTNIHLALAGSSSLWGGQIVQGGMHSDYEETIRTVISRTPAGKRVHFLGKIAAADMAATYAFADIIVVPSVWREAFGQVALEALSTSRPVIASSTGGLVEFVNQQNGVLVPPGDEESLHAAMLRLISNPALRAQMGIAARQRALEFSWERSARQLDEIYAGALARKGR